MEYKQGTVGEILESEKVMVEKASERYGAFAQHAFDCSLFLGHFLKSIDPDRWIFASFLSLLKKHHTLALFSTVRLHQVQSTMNLRQVLEAGALAAFAIAEPDHSHFVARDSRGLINHSQKLTSRIYAWLDKNYSAGSKNIRDIKALINESTAHANLLYTLNNFATSQRERAFLAPFFDFEDEYYVKTDLWRIGNIAIGLMDLFYGVNDTLNVIKFVDDFPPRLQRLVQQSNALRTEMTATERYKQAMQMATKPDN